MGKLFNDLIKHSENTLQEELNKEWKEIKPLNAIEYANWIEDYKSKIESKYFELFKKAREEDKQELISKACRWLEDNAKMYSDDIAINCLLANFKVAMEDLK